MIEQKVVYTGGPFTADTVYGERLNIRNAEAWALAIWKAGHVALCPHMNTANFSGEMKADDFIRGDLELLARCDAILLLPGWERSRGTLIELKVATLLGIPVYHWNDPNKFAAFLDGREDD